MSLTHSFPGNDSVSRGALQGVVQLSGGKEDQNSEGN